MRVVEERILDVKRRQTIFAVAQELEPLLRSTKLRSPIAAGQPDRLVEGRSHRHVFAGIIHLFVVVSVYEIFHL